MMSISTILSVFNEKGTLLKWLQKLEKAMAGGALKSVTVMQSDAESAQFKFNFEDGTAITSDSVELPAGTPGPQGEPGKDGTPGPQGEPGKDGNSVVSITTLGYTQGTGVNEGYTETSVNLDTDEETMSFKVFAKNGEKGKDGAIQAVADYAHITETISYNSIVITKIFTTDGYLHNGDYFLIITESGNQGNAHIGEIYKYTGQNISVGEPVGSHFELISSIKGAKGESGNDGENGNDGVNGFIQNIGHILYVGYNGQPPKAYLFVNKTVNSDRKIHAGELILISKIINELPTEYSYLKTGIVLQARSNLQPTDVNAPISIEDFINTTGIDLQGATGEKGADGKDALVYTKIFEVEDISDLPSVILISADFNRTPSVNEKFILYYTNGGNTYISVVSVSQVSGTMVLGIIDENQTYQLNAVSKPLYQHNIYMDHPTYQIYFSFVSSSSDKITKTNIINFIYNNTSLHNIGCTGRTSGDWCVYVLFVYEETRLKFSYTGGSSGNVEIFLDNELLTITDEIKEL